MSRIFIISCWSVGVYWNSAQISGEYLNTRTQTSNNFCSMLIIFLFILHLCSSADQHLIYAECTKDFKRQKMALWQKMGMLQCYCRVRDACWETAQVSCPCLKFINSKLFKCKSLVELKNLLTSMLHSAFNCGNARSKFLEIFLLSYQSYILGVGYSIINSVIWRFFHKY